MPGTRFTDEFLDQMRQIADSAADDVIKRIVEREGLPGVKTFFDRLIRQIEMPLAELPPEAQEFLNQNKKLPEWTDFEKVRLANDLFVDHGPKCLIFLYYKSLPILYTCANGAQVLVQTGRLAHSDSTEQFTRRIAETGQFLVDVMAPGNLTSGNGINTILKVRLIHAAIRQFVTQGQWDEQVLGKPINQEDLAITLMTFSVAILDALEQFNIQESKDKKEAYLHCWKVIGAVLGIQEELLPRNLEEGKELLEKIISRQAKASEQGQILTRALIEFGQLNLQSKLFKNTPEVLIRYMVGPDLSAKLGLTAAGGCTMVWLPEALKKLFGFVEKLEDRSEPLHQLIDVLARELTLRMVNYFNTYKNRPFKIPATLEKQWLS